MIRQLREIEMLQTSEGALERMMPISREIKIRRCAGRVEISQRKLDAICLVSS